MLRITLRIAKRRTERSLDVKPPSRKTGCVKRFVVTIGTTTPVSASAALKRSTILSRSAPDVPNGMRSSSWNETPHAPSSARRWTVSTGSSGGGVGSPNGSWARQPTVHSPKENLFSGVALVLMWPRVSRLGHHRGTPGPSPARSEVRLAGVLLRGFGCRVDRQPGQPADRQGRQRDRYRRPWALARVSRPAALRQRPRRRPGGPHRRPRRQLRRPGAPPARAAGLREPHLRPSGAGRGRRPLAAVLVLLLLQRLQPHREHHQGRSARGRLGDDP